MKRQKDLNKIIAEKQEYDKESQDFLESLVFEDKEISQINEMKSTSGWKLLDKKIREDLHYRITELVKDDLKIQTLLALLKVADTKSRAKILDNEIDRILPE